MNKKQRSNERVPLEKSLSKRIKVVSKILKQTVRIFAAFFTGVEGWFVLLVFDLVDLLHVDILRGSGLQSLLVFFVVLREKGKETNGSAKLTDAFDLLLSVFQSSENI